MSSGFRVGLNGGERFWVHAPSRAGGSLRFFSTILACVAAALPAAGQAAFEDCGKLIHGAECVLFESDSAGTYILDELDHFVVGDRVRVRGLLKEDCISTCMQGDGCISVVDLSYCGGEPVKACGVLVQGVECVLFEDDKGFLFALDNLGGFQPGERVVIDGKFDQNCASVCQQGTGCIRENTIAADADGDCIADQTPDNACATIGFGFATLLTLGMVRGRSRLTGGG